LICQEEDGFTGLDKKRFRYDPAVSANPESGSSDEEGNGEAGDEDFMADEFGDDDLEGKRLIFLFFRF